MTKRTARKRRKTPGAAVLEDRNDLVQSYLREVASAICLADWVVLFRPESRPEDCEGMVDIEDGQRASIALCPQFWGLPPEYQRQILVHELCHLYFDRLRGFKNQLRRVLQGREFELLEEHLEDCEEHVTEMFARVIAPCLPLPKFT